MLGVIGGVFAICVAIIAGVSISNRSDSPKVTETHAAESVVTDSQGATVSETETTRSPYDILAEEIVGKWTDSAQMSGYEFFSDGTVIVTYVNLTVPVVNLPINGTAKGTYSLSEDNLTVKFSIYSKTIENNYKASIENNALSLYDKEERETATYERVTASQETTTAASGENTQPDDSLAGSWTNGDSSIKYVFNGNGGLTVSFSNAVVPQFSKEAITGIYSGVYITAGDKVTVQFMMGSEKITAEYSFVVSGNSLSLKDNTGDTTILIRSGSASNNTSNSLVGQWKDGSGMSGYNFKDGGTVEITYVNFTVPVVNMPINGTYSGSYVTEGNKITISASIYSNTVTNTYTYTVNDNTLTLINVEDGAVSTYTRK